MRILIVDDSPDNQELLSVLLEGWGARITVASNGKEGLDLALNSEPDVVLMDVQMPVMDGHESVVKLREKGFRKPIAALTAHAMVEEKARCEASGFSHFLSKPINKESLLSVLLDTRSRIDPFSV